MPLLEIIKGEKTSDETLYRALDVVKQIKKTPIVVNDSRGFFTSRVIGTFIIEGDRACSPRAFRRRRSSRRRSQAGYPAPVLQLSDELNLKLMRKIRVAAEEAGAGGGSGWENHPSIAVIDRMLTSSTAPASCEGAGFYDYEDGKRTRPVGRACATRSGGRRPDVAVRATSRSGCCSSRRSRRSSASTRA